MPITAHEPCPCGGGRRFADCCEPVLAGAAAPTAEALMRSRYTAHVLGDAGHLARSCCPGSLASIHEPAALDPDIRWLDLRILRTEGGGADDRDGVVEFVARFKRQGRAGRLHEVSRFRRAGAGWCYLDGEPGQPQQKPRTSRRRP
jgi:SEC-C motif-containing protein